MIAAPKIDQLAGMKCYSTDFAGIKGAIKQSSEGFKVLELIDSTIIDGLSSTFDEHHRYPLYILEKKDIDSNHALFEIEQQYNIKLKIMGIKDAKAVTKQYASLERAQRNPRQELRTKHTHLIFTGYTKKPIGRESLSGNEFTITVYNPLFTDISSFIPQIENIGNFYGLQRFGSERLVTHLVGKEIIKRNFRRAIELILSYTTEYDSAMSKEIRHASTDPKNYPRLLKQMPKGMDIERKVMSALISGKDHFATLRAIPIGIRRLYVQAYQAYVFNRCVSAAIQNGENLISGKEGDLCFEMEGPNVFGRIKKFDPTSEVAMVPAIRLVGYTFQPGKGRFETITKNIMQEEGISAKEFHVKEMQELSQQGGFRQAPLWCREFTYSERPFTVSFKLPKGSYATTLLRELMKPEEPIEAGF